MGRLVALIIGALLIAPRLAFGADPAVPLPPLDELIRPAPPTQHYAKGAVILRSPARNVINAGQVAPGVVGLRYSYQGPAQGQREKNHRVPVGQPLVDIELFIMEQNGAPALVAFVHEIYVHKVNGDGSIDAVVETRMETPQPRR